MHIDLVFEHEIRSDLHREITGLRNASFPAGALPRSYFKQLPHFRILAFEEDVLVGHLGVDHRVMNFAGNPLRVFGAIDVCVAASHRRKGIGSEMISCLEEEARKSEADLLLLIADDHRVYRKAGFELLKAECEWLAIDDHKNHGLLQESLDGELLIKPLRPELVPAGPVDFLGYLY
ncbi:MAG: GNAT family N-acetyltransferase [Verrucomicrobiota bacterium]